MAIFDKLGQQTAVELQQYLLGALDRLEEIVRELRDETTVEITIRFERKKKEEQGDRHQ